MGDLRSAAIALSHEQFADGRARLESIVRDEPKSADAWALLSGARLATADVPGAESAVARALELAPDRFLPRMKAAELALRLGDHETAERGFGAALRVAEPGSPDAAAAQRALHATRRAIRSGISHGARLPEVGSLSRHGRRITQGLAALRRRWPRSDRARGAS